MLPLPPDLALLLLEQATDCISLHDPDGTVRWASVAAHELFGVPPETLVGRSPLGLLHPDERPWAAQALVSMLKQAGSAPYVTRPFRVRHAEGTQRWLEIRVRALRDAATGRATQLVVVSRDVTPRVEAEQQAAAERELHERLFEDSMVGETILKAIRDPATGAIVDFQHIRRNRRAREQALLHGDPVEAVGPGTPTMLQRFPASATTTFPRFREVLANGQPWEGEQPYQTPAGRNGYVTRIAPLSADQIRISWLNLTPVQELTARLTEEQHLFGAVFELSAAGLSIFEAVRDAGGRVADFRIVRRNPQALWLLNLSTTDVGALISEQYPLMMTNGLMATFAQVIETGESWHQEVRYQEPPIDGWYDVFVTRLDEARICLSFTDLTPIRRAEERLAESQTGLALGAEVAGLGLADRDLRTGRVRLTPQYARLCCLPETALEMDVAELRARVNPLDQQTAGWPPDPTGAPPALERETRLRFRRFDTDEERLFLTRTRLLHDAQGEPVRLLSATLDITDSQTHINRAAAAENQLALAAEVAGMGTTERFIGTDELLISPAYARLIGLPADTSRIKLANVVALFNPTDIRDVFIPYQQAIERGEQAGAIRLRGHRADTGAPFTLLAMARLWPGPPARVQSAALDITTLVEVEQAALDAQAQLALAAEATGLGLSIRDVAADTLAVTPAFAELYGLPPSTARVRLSQLLDLTHPDDRRTLRPAFEAALGQPGRTGQAQFRIRRADTGHERVLLSTARAEGDTHGITRRVLAVTLDVTDIARARAATEQLRLWQTLTDGLPEILWVSGPGLMKTEMLNQRWYDYTGHTPAVLLDQSWVRAVHPEDLASPTTNAAVRQALAEGTPYELKMRLRRHDGIWRWFLARAAPLFDSAGTLTHWVGLTMDIHEREMAERALRRANADLDTFVYAAAHDLKSPIDNLEAVISALQEEYDERRRNFPSPFDDTIAALHRHAEQAVGRFRATLADLAQVVDTQAPPDAPDQPLGLATHVADLVLDMEAEFATAHGLLCLDLQVSAVRGLPARHLRSVLFNLIGNALKYRHPDRPARLWLRARAIGASWVELALTDNGLGLDSAKAARAFELFGRLHPGAAGGTGIGLFIVRRVVEQAGGKLRLNGRPGVGTTFAIRLPRR